MEFINGLTNSIHWVSYVFGLLSASLFILIYNSKARIHANAVIRQAKREVQDIAQISLNNPYPQIQISNDKKIIFINPAAQKEFPTLQQQQSDHQILKHIDNDILDKDFLEREISYNKKYFSQTVTKIKTVLNKGGYIIYCYDITERKKYEMQLQKAYSIAEISRVSAEQAKEARGNFLANMSHEIRTPMNGIVGLSEILLDAELEEDSLEMAVAINTSAQNLLLLLNDILDFTKIEAGELSFEYIPIDIGDIINKINMLHNNIAQQKGIKFIISLSSDVPKFLLGDPSRLQQIINNIVGNALKFTSEGSVNIAFTGKYIDKENYLLKIDISDTGIGISQEKQSLIFEKFQQADSSTTRQFGGTGLGLSITKDLTDMMNGTLSVASESNKGSTFTIEIPFSTIQQNISEDTELNKPKQNDINPNLKILIVDDHPINLLYLKNKFKTFGLLKPDEATNGQEALDLFKNNFYDLILMDCQMPEMDGFEATRTIRQIEKNYNMDPVVIIAVTANAMTGAEEECKKAGMNGYITKPIDQDKLYSILKQNFLNLDILQNVQTMPKKNAHSSIFDWDRLNEMTDGDTKLSANIIKIFVENLVNDMQKLNSSYIQNDKKAWDEWAHKIYGACINIGATNLAETCDKIQCFSKDIPDKKIMTQLQQGAETAYLELMQELKEYRDI